MYINNIYLHIFNSNETLIIHKNCITQYFICLVYKKKI